MSKWPLSWSCAAVGKKTEVDKNIMGKADYKEKEESSDWSKSRQNNIQGWAEQATEDIKIDVDCRQDWRDRRYKLIGGYLDVLLMAI